MAVERWLDLDMYGTQNVVDLGQGFELLPAENIEMPTETDGPAFYTLVMVSQVRRPTNRCVIRAHSILSGAIC